MNEWMNGYFFLFRELFLLFLFFIIIFIITYIYSKGGTSFFIGLCKFPDNQAKKSDYN